MSQLNPWMRWNARYAQFLVHLRQNGFRIADAPTSIGWSIVPGEGHRTPQRQAELYARGRITKGPIVTNAKPGQSPHNHSLARDLNVYFCGKAITDGKHPIWREIYKCASSAGLTTGLHWRNICDPGHVELPNWRKVLRQWQDKHSDGG